MPSFFLLCMRMQNDDKQIKRYDTLVTVGLSKQQVEERINDQLVNKTKLVVGKSYLEIILTNVFSFFNILLYAIAVLMIIAKKYDGLFFMGVLIPNIIIGLYEDIKVRRLMGKLHIVNAPRSHVVREGEDITIPSEDLALDDIVLLKTNDQICADSIVMEGTIGVNESLLTGESQTIYKKVGDTVFLGNYEGVHLEWTVRYIDTKKNYKLLMCNKPVLTTHVNDRKNWKKTWEKSDLHNSAVDTADNF